jgi:hypothetical protein
VDEPIIEAVVVPQTTDREGKSFYHNVIENEKS